MWNHACATYSTEQHARRHLGGPCPEFVGHRMLFNPCKRNMCIRMWFVELKITWSYELQKTFALTLTFLKLSIIFCCQDSIYFFITRICNVNLYLFTETLRLFPPLARVDRVCTKPYTVPGSSIHLEPGNVVAIPLYGIHMDPEYYPEPKEFRPERFMNEEKKDRASHLYLAFGVGPRNCIGKRHNKVGIIQNILFSTIIW